MQLQCPIKNRSLTYRCCPTLSCMRRPPARKIRALATGMRLPRERKVRISGNTEHAIARIMLSRVVATARCRSPGH
ncbi:protein of unknown function [Pararobbsia alpina]